MSSPSKPTTIDDLPSEMIFELFDQLNIEDLVVCSMVNKRWHSIYSSFRVDRLAAITGFLYGPGNWRYSQRQVKDKEQCHPRMLGRLVGKSLLSNLTHLALCGYQIQFDLNKLNEFENHLVHLEINIEHLSSSGKPASLKLQKLKLLSFLQFFPYTSLSVDCPKLTTLIYTEPDHMNLLDLKNPETIRRLESNMSNSSKLARFSQVESLLTQKFTNISKPTLLALPNLKELDYIERIENAFLQSGTLDRMKQTLREFLDDSKLLKGSDFCFRFAGLKLTDSTLKEIDFGAQTENEAETVSSEQVYLNNYQLIDPNGTLEFADRLSYNLVISNAADGVTDCFFNKFTGVKLVEASGRVQDANHFLWFLSSLKSVKQLNLLNSKLNQSFYNQLPSAVHSLARLQLQEDDELGLSFGFIGGFKCLSELHLDQAMSFESLVSLIRSIRKESRWFCFHQKKNSFYIEKNGHSIVCKFNRKRFKTENPEEMANFIESCKSERLDSSQDSVESC